MTTARASKAGELFVKRFGLGDVTPEYVAQLVDECTGLAELEADYAKMVATVLEAADCKERLLAVVDELLADGSNGAARTLAQVVLTDIRRAE